jgi:transposase
MSDAEWAFFEPFVIERGLRRGRRHHDPRLLLDGVFWIARTGFQWRDLPESFGHWNAVYKQFRSWTLSGVWDLMLEALNDTGEGQPSMQVIHSTTIHHQDAEHAIGGLKAIVLATRQLAVRLKST